MYVSIFEDDEYDNVSCTAGNSEPSCCDGIVSEQNMASNQELELKHNISYAAFFKKSWSRTHKSM